MHNSHSRSSKVVDLRRRRYRVASGGRSSSVTTTRCTPPEVGWWDTIVLPDLIDPSLSGSAQATFPLVIGWPTEEGATTEGVVDFGTNQKGVCDFLSVIDSNFGPVLHRF